MDSSTGDDAVPPDKISVDGNLLTEKTQNKLSTPLIATREQKRTDELATTVQVSPVHITTDTPNRKLPTPPRRLSLTKDYRTLYADLKQKYTQLNDAKKAALALANEKFEVLKGEIIKDKSKMEDDMLKCQAELKAKDDRISSLEKDKLDTDGLIEGLKKQNSYLQDLVEKSKLPKQDHIIVHREDGDEVVKTKSNAKSRKSEQLKCATCENNNEQHLIKCNSCSDWICDSCTDVGIAKIKPIINKCKSVYFTCNVCTNKAMKSNVNIRVDHTRNEIKKNNTITNNDQLLATISGLIEEKVNNLEKNMTKLIDDKLASNVTVSTPIAKEAHEENKLTYAKALQVPTEIKKIMQDAKNEEKVEQQEIERRSANFIIRGAEEIGRNEEKIKDNDNDYVSDIFKKLGVSAKPLNVIRLGKRNDAEKRPIKVVMNNKSDKQKVMTNLRRLKGTESEFGYISITDDYTANEREQIRKFSAMAKDKTEKSTSSTYKVRGNPKNGLRIVEFPGK